MIQIHFTGMGCGLLHTSRISPRIPFLAGWILIPKCLWNRNYQLKCSRAIRIHQPVKQMTLRARLIEWYCIVVLFQVDALIAEFTDNMAGLEKKLGAERARMAAVSTGIFCCFIKYYGSHSLWFQMFYSHWALIFFSRSRTVLRGERR